MPRRLVPQEKPRPEALALLHDVKENPDDDGLRLVLADWLEDHGDARAELIRVQVELAKLKRLDPRWKELDRQEAKILKEHGRPWRDALKAMGGKCRFSRGLLGRYHVVASKLLRAPWESWRNTEALAWLDGLYTTDVDSWFPRVASCPALEFINELHTCHLLQFGAETVAALARYERAPYLRSLGFRNANLTVDDALPLTAAPYWRQLRRLGLSANKLGDRVGELLPFCAGLLSLDVGTNGIGAAGLEALASSPHLSRLTDLNLTDNPITTAGAKALAGATAFPDLEWLSLWGCCLGRSEAEALAQTRREWPRLRHLRLGSNKLTGVAVAALADSPLLDNVESLDLSFNNELTDNGLVALAASPRCRNLVELDLQYTSVGDEGARALLESAHLSKLAYLIVSNTRIGNGAKYRLRKRFGAGVRG
jgi:uncharacterized protein (TIGR02996 family)